MNFGTSGTGGRIEKAGTGETSGTGREFLNMNFELGISCKLALVGGKKDLTMIQIQII